MTRHRTDPQLTKISHRANTAAHILPGIQTHLANQLAHTDTNTTNETGITSNTINDPVITQVLARAHITDHQTRIKQIIDRIETSLNELDAAFTRAQHGQPKPTHTIPTCPGGDPSTWGDPTCSDLVEYSIRSDGTRYERDLCPTHRKRRERHQRAQDTYA